MPGSVHLLRRLRERAELSVDEMAMLVGLDAEAVEALERGAPYVHQEVLERYALALGMSVDAVLADHEPSAVAMLFRSMRAHGTSISAFASSGLQDVLGAFVRCVRDTATLRGLLGERPGGLQWLDQIPATGLPPRASIHEQAHRLASELRAFLGLGPDAPIESMRALAGQLGITTLFVELEDEQVGHKFDGAALLDPDPAILVNLVSGGDKWWRTRMTIAHEICHLLHDRDALDPSRPRKFFLWSPQRPDRNQASPWQLTEHFDDLEVRANSFAGELLAPSIAIQKLLRGQDPTRFEAVKRVGDHFMIGATVAINRLRDTFALSQQQRSRLHAQAHAAGLAGKLATALPGPHADEASAELPGPEFAKLVLRALAGGVIDTITARAYLGLRLSERLPEGGGLPESARAPLMSPTQRARNAATRYLMRLASAAPGADILVTDLQPAEHGWRAAVGRRSAPDGVTSVVGDLDIAEDFQVLEPAWRDRIARP